MRAADSRPLLGLDLYRPAPADNPPTVEKIGLGRELFTDRRLSRDGSMSCASCHRPDRAFTDGRRIARGVNGIMGRRNVPTIVDRAWGASFFWDGRALSLEQQALEPILNPVELAMTPNSVLQLVRSSRYRSRFISAFGVEPTMADVGRALAAYVRTIESGDSPYDRFLAGDRGALTESARRGLDLFEGKGRCGSCHTGPLLSDEQFHNTGIAFRSAQARDEGRAAVTGRNEDLGAFKTPTLREVARTAPYMHDGSLATLGDVIEYYDRGGAPNPRLDPRIHRLNLSSAERQQLVEFLKALSGEVRDGR